MENKVVILVGFVSLIAVAALLIQSYAPTGAIVDSQPSQGAQAAMTLNDVVRDFFRVRGVVFPKGSCMEIPTELYNNLAFRPVSYRDFVAPVRSNTVQTQSEERSSTIMYRFEATHVGALELVHGNIAVNSETEDSFINIISETPAHIPKLTRVAHVELSLFGTSEDLFYITRGTLRTPALLCDFVVEDNGVVCECQPGRTYDYAAAKVGLRIAEPLRP